MCPLCKETNCKHVKRFLNFSLEKIILLQENLSKNLNSFNKLLHYFPNDKEIHGKLSNVIEELTKSHEKMLEVKSLCIKKII